MKTLTYLASLVFLFTSCNCQKASTNSETTKLVDNTQTISNLNQIQEEIPTIEYGANARNMSLAVKVQNKMLYVSKQRDFKDYETKITLSDKDWNDIVVLTKKIDLTKVKDWKWPTEIRYYDGAPHANVTFFSKGVAYPAAGFDHGHPPAEGEALINKILSLVPKE